MRDLPRTCWWTLGGMMLGRMVGERWSKSTSGVKLTPNLAARF